MPILKLSLFIVMTLFAIFLSYIWYEEAKYSGSVGGVNVTAILIFIIAITLFVISLLSIVILLQAPRYYTFIFLSLWSIALITLLVYTAIENYQTEQQHHQQSLQNSEEKVLEKAWTIMLNDKAEAYRHTKYLTTKNQKIEHQKIAIYFALSLKDSLYEEAFQSNLLKHQKDVPYIINYFLEHYSLSNETQYLKVLNLLNKKDSLEYIIPYKKHQEFSFNRLLQKKYYLASLKILDFKAINQHYLQDYLQLAKTINHATYRKEAITKILQKAKIYNQTWNKTSTITALSPTVLTLQKEEAFPHYLKVLEAKLKASLSNKWEIYQNQPVQEAFIQMYTLLGASHTLIQTIPSDLKEHYLEEEKKILKHGKENYIVYRNHMTQVEGDITHVHAYTDEPYSILIKGKVVHKGLTNEYGCMQYKYYGAKATDKIEIQSRVSIGGVQSVGWVSLLPPWNTDQGMLDRIAGLGFSHYPPETIEDYIRRFQNRYNLENNENMDEETKKKAKELFEAFMDEKWCKNIL